MTYRSPRLKQRPDELPHQGIPGHVYLFEACDIIGKQMFPTEWNGRELLARSLDEIGDALRGPYRPPLLLGADDGLVDDELLTGLPTWFVDQPNGETRSFSSRDGALSNWERVVPEAKAFAEAERAARVRFQTVRDFLLAWLRSDGTAFVYYPKTGTHAQLTIEFWRRRDAWHFFEMRDRPYEWENPNEYVQVFPLAANATPISAIEHLIARNSPLLREAEAFAEALRERHSGNIIVRACDLPIPSHGRPYTPAAKKVSAGELTVFAGPRSSGYAEADQKLFPEIKRLKETGKARSAYGAALMLARAGRVAGDGTHETRAKRVASRFLKDGQ